MDKRNALEELAEELGVIHDVANRGCTHETKIAKVVKKAQRIVAELSKVEFLTTGHGVVLSAILWQANQAVIKCREIAEEGAA